MKYLVTGSKGKLGTILVEKLQSFGEVVVLDLNDDPSRDIRKMDDVNAVMEGVDVVFHLAALTDVQECEENPKECLDTNVWGSINVIASAWKHDVKKFIFASSSAVYGTGKPIETLDVEPETSYGNSKLVAEKYLIDKTSVTKMQPACIRIFPNMNPINAISAMILVSHVDNLKYNIFNAMNEGKSNLYKLDLKQLNKNRDIIKS